ncbi:hypothetical protein CYANOKiyG1_18670 [Okeania sp. KiyG1]|nr:hypothetical protein CYANOKiyG1_18670 [Okeania sp. KiyG1]
MQRLYKVEKCFWVAHITADMKKAIEVIQSVAETKSGYKRKGDLFYPQILYIA